MYGALAPLGYMGPSGEAAPYVYGRQGASRLGRGERIFAASDFLLPYRLRYVLCPPRSVSALSSLTGPRRGDAGQTGRRAAECALTGGGGRPGRGGADRGVGYEGLLPVGRARARAGNCARAGSGGVCARDLVRGWVDRGGRRTLQRERCAADGGGEAEGLSPAGLARAGWESGRARADGAGVGARARVRADPAWGASRIPLSHNASHTASHTASRIPPFPSAPPLPHTHLNTPTLTRARELLACV